MVWNQTLFKEFAAGTKSDSKQANQEEWLARSVNK